jgi:hypothetical protein
MPAVFSLNLMTGCAGPYRAQVGPRARGAPGPFGPSTDGIFCLEAGPPPTSPEAEKIPNKTGKNPKINFRPKKSARKMLENDRNIQDKKKQGNITIF